MMERNSAYQSPARAHSSVHLFPAQIQHVLKTQTPLGKRIRGRPNGLIGLRPVTVRILGDHFIRVEGIVAMPL
jgi:hypothetical protein